MKKTLLVLTMIVVGVTATAYAANFESPAQFLAEVQGEPVESVYQQRQAGTRFGQIAQDEGVFEEFRQEMLEWKSSIIDQRVEEGILTPAEAEEFKTALEERINACTGTFDSDRTRLGQSFGGGMGFGGCQGTTGGGGRGYGRQRIGFGRQGKGFGRQGR